MGPLAMKTVAELLILLGNGRVETAHIGCLGHKCGQRGLIVD